MFFSYYEKIGSEIKDISDEIPFDIPETWRYVKLSDVSEITMGSSPSGTSINNNGVGIEFHQGKICFSDKVIAHSDKFTDNPVKLSKENSVLLCVRAPVGEVNITDRVLCIGRGLASIYPLANIKAEFLFYWMQNFKTILNTKATGSTFVAITADTVKDLIIPIPPLQEQERILYVINKTIAIIDEIEKSLS